MTSQQNTASEMKKLSELYKTKKIEELRKQIINTIKEFRDFMILFPY